MNGTKFMEIIFDYYKLEKLKYFKNTISKEMKKVIFLTRV